MSVSQLIVVLWDKVADGPAAATGTRHDRQIQMAIEIDKIFRVIIG
jgi:hypothetical protein